MSLFRRIVEVEQGRRKDWIAQQMGVSHSLVSLWINGHKIPDDSQRQALAKLLGRKELVRESAYIRAEDPPVKRRSDA